MPKRKAPNAAGDAADSGVKSPTPHKKSRAEARAAAREWHENRLKAAAGSTPTPAASAPSGSKKIAAPQVTKSTPRTDRNEIVKNGTSTTRQMLGSMSSAAAPSPTGGNSKITKSEEGSVTAAAAAGSNAFLKSLRTESRSAVVSKKEDPPSKPVSSSALIQGSSTYPTKTAASQLKLTHKSSGFLRRMLRFLFILGGLGLNIALIIGILNYQTSSFDEFERQHDSEVTRLTQLVSKNRDLIDVLRSGAGVLEEKVQRKWRAIQDLLHGGNNSNENQDAVVDEADRLTSEEEKNNFIEALRSIEEQLEEK